MISTIIGMVVNPCILLSYPALSLNPFSDYPPKLPTETISEAI